MNEVIWWAGASVLTLSAIYISFYLMFHVMDMVWTNVLKWRHAYWGLVQMIWHPKAWESWKKKWHEECTKLLEQAKD